MGDTLARALALQAMKQAGEIGGVESVNGKTGNVHITASDIGAASDKLVKDYSLGRVYATMQPQQTADVTEAFGYDEFKALCEDIYNGEKRVVVIDGMVATITPASATSIIVDLHEFYDVDGTFYGYLYAFGLSADATKVVLDCISNIESDLEAQTQPDFNVTDMSSPAFIKNSPIYPVKVRSASVSQGYTTITIDKTRQQIMSAITFGQTVMMTYNGMSFTYSNNGAAGFHHFDMVTSGTIMGGENNVATGVKDTCFLFTSTAGSANTMILTTITLQK